MVFKFKPYCRTCSKFMHEDKLIENKLGAKNRCPTCKQQVRLTPSTSSKNRTLKRKSSLEV